MNPAVASITAPGTDPRDAPSDWPTGIVPYLRTRAYELPAPPYTQDDSNIAYRLNRKLADCAFAQTRNLALEDDAETRKLRAPYSGPGGKPPFDLEADGLMSTRFWFGEKLTEWARRWMRYWTHDEGTFVMSAEEDTGITQALTFVVKARRRDSRKSKMARSLAPCPSCCMSETTSSIARVKRSRSLTFRPLASAA